MEYDKNLYTSLESIAEKYNDLNNQIENYNKTLIKYNILY